VRHDGRGRPCAGCSRSYPTVQRNEQPIKRASLLASALSAAALALASVPAAADAERYVGKTKAGTRITFKQKGKRVSKLKTLVPVVCVSPQTSTPRGGTDLFRPPKAVRIGGESKQNALQPSAVAGWEVTKYYTLNLKRQGNKTKGKLRLSFSFLVPDLWDPRTYFCDGTTRFTAKPK
jgi:hypothetical protein